VVAATVLAWATTGWHGADAALVGLAGALAATVKRWTGIDLKTALKRVEWGLILFLASTLLLAETLLSSGAAAALAAATLGMLPDSMRQPLPVLALCTVVALASHLVITSRTARVVVLVPTVVVPLAASGLNPALLILLATLGSGFCQSFQVSAKPVTVYARTEVPTFSDGDLLRLSAALLPVMFGLLMGFSAVVWPLQGLALRAP
jgi:solute carrier family 13 (sodium-dependent dicarboxylate transporter), member 2/3/5